MKDRRSARPLARRWRQVIVLGLAGANAPGSGLAQSGVPGGSLYLIHQYILVDRGGRALNACHAEYNRGAWPRRLRLQSGRGNLSQPVISYRHGPLSCRISDSDNGGSRAATVSVELPSRGDRIAGRPWRIQRSRIVAAENDLRPALFAALAGGASSSGAAAVHPSGPVACRRARLQPAAVADRHAIRRDVLRR